MTQVATVYTGPDDPADTFAVVPGDLWVDTAPISGSGLFGALHVTKVRTADGWNLLPLVAKDASGNLTSLVFLDPAGSITANVLDTSGNVRVSLLLDIASGTPTATLVVSDATGTPKAGFTFGEDGVFQIIATALSVVGFPTANPGPGLWWNDGGTVTVGT